MPLKEDGQHEATEPSDVYVSLYPHRGTRGDGCSPNLDFYNILEIFYV